LKRHLTNKQFNYS